MAPKNEEDWSDSDDEDLIAMGEVEDEDDDEVSQDSICPAREYKDDDEDGTDDEDSIISDEDSIISDDE